MRAQDAFEIPTLCAGVGVCVPGRNARKKAAPAESGKVGAMTSSLGGQIGKIEK